MVPVARYRSAASPLLRGWHNIFAFAIINAYMGWAFGGFLRLVVVVGRAVTTEEGPAASFFLSADQEARAEEAVLWSASFANLSASI